MTSGVKLVVARKPRCRDGGGGRHPRVPLDAYVARAAAAPRSLKMGGHAREYAPKSVCGAVVATGCVAHRYKSS